MIIGPLPLWPLHITEPLAVGCGEIGHVLKDAADAGFPAQAYPSAVTGDDLAQGFSIGQAAADVIEGDVAVNVNDTLQPTRDTGISGLRV